MEVKRPKVVVTTHNGKFHTDEIFAVATLYLALEKEYEIEVIRTRDVSIIQTAEYVVDVGMIYDPDNNRFDHHQHGGAGVHTIENIPYASFGLVWKKYGLEICGTVEVAEGIEKMLVLPIDAGDNGVVVFSKVFENVQPYTAYDIFEGAYKPTWKEDSSMLDANFMYLVGLAKEILKREIIQVRDKKEAEAIVNSIYHKSNDKRIIVLDMYYPWNDVLRTYTDTRLVIYPSFSSNWHIQVVTDKDDFINSRISFPKTWGGLRDSDLVTVTGIPGSIFCTAGLYLVVAENKESAIELAHKALAEAGQ